MMRLNWWLVLSLLFTCYWNNDIKASALNVSEDRIPHGKGPDFFLIGTTKAATTSLYQLLTRHKDICPSKTKEIHFFDHPDMWKKGLYYYESFFSRKHCAASTKFIDATPNYFDHVPSVPERIANSFSKEDLHFKKFLLVLRDPTDREFSWYNHIMKHCVKAMNDYMHRHHHRPAGGWSADGLCADKHCHPLGCTESNTLQNASAGKAQQYLFRFKEYTRTHSGQSHRASGFYEQLIASWLHYIDRKQLMILNFEQLLQNITDIIYRLEEFFELPHHMSNKWQLPHENGATLKTEFDCASRRELQALYAPYNERLYKYMNDSFHSNPFEPSFHQFTQYSCRV